MAISLAFFPFSTALEIELDYPATVELNSEFDVLIDFEANDSYDVKIFVHDSPDSGVTQGEYISDIYNPEKAKWQTSWNYLLNSFPTQKTYSLEVTESPGERQLCVRVRKTGADASSTKCGSITVTGEDNPSEDTDDGEDDLEQEDGEDEEESDEEDENEDDEEEDDEIRNITYIQTSVSNGIVENITNDLGVIHLNPTKKAENVETQEPIMTKKGKTRFGLLIGFNFVCVMIIAFLLLKKL